MLKHNKNNFPFLIYFLCLREFHLKMKSKTDLTERYLSTMDLSGLINCAKIIALFLALILINNHFTTRNGVFIGYCFHSNSNVHLTVFTTKNVG